MYAACRRFGLIHSFREHGWSSFVEFVASDKVDELKAGHTIHFEFEEAKVKFVSDKILIPSLPDPELPPSNMLVALNDDCLDAVFSKLEWCDLIRLMNVCHRFKDIAERVASRKHVITNDYYAPLWQQEHYLRKFGASIRTIHAMDNHPHQMILLFLIAKYCPNVDELEIASINSEIRQPLHNLFKRVRKLCITEAVENGRLINKMASLDGILYHDSQLESLHIGSPAKFDAFHLPNLVEVELTSPGYLAPFLSANPQIEKLSLIDTCFYESIDGYLGHLPHLQELTLKFAGMPDMEEVPSFGGLGRLHTFRLMEGRRDIIVMILNALIESGIQLKRLALFDTWNRYPIDIICRMTSVEYLEIDYITDIDIMELATNGVNIKEVDVPSYLTLPSVIDVLKSLPGRSALEKIGFKADSSKINKTSDVVVLKNELKAIDGLRSDVGIDVQVLMILPIAQHFEDIEVTIRHILSWLAVLHFFYFY